LPPFISFSTGYPEMDSAVLRHTDKERFVGDSEPIAGAGGLQPLGVKFEFAAHGCDIKTLSLLLD
jgi:hypothetical protein